MAIYTERQRLYKRIIKSKLKLPNQNVALHPDLITEDKLKKLTKDELIFLCNQQGVQQTWCDHTHTAKMRLEVEFRNQLWHKENHECTPKKIKK